MEHGATGVALEALRLLTTRSLDEGAEAYRRALVMADGDDVPVSRHLRLLRGSGHHETTALVERIAIEEGKDIASIPITNHRDPRGAVAEYEALFARGAANSKMMTHYLAALSRIGASERLAAVHDLGTLLRRTTLDVGVPLAPFLASVAEALLNAPTRQLETQRKSFRGIQRVCKTNTLRDPALVALHRAVRRQVADYIAEIKSSGHMIAPWLSPQFSLPSWGGISEGSGYHAPHIHGGCWVVAIAYIAGEASASGTGVAGTLRIGPAVEGDPACAGWPDVTVPPIPGSLVIMPSFYTHWTEPLARPGLRISVSFNADEPERPFA